MRHLKNHATFEEFLRLLRLNFPPVPCAHEARWFSVGFPFVHYTVSLSPPVLQHAFGHPHPVLGEWFVINRELCHSDVKRAMNVRAGHRQPNQPLPLYQNNHEEMRLLLFGTTRSLRPCKWTREIGSGYESVLLGRISFKF
jgi:hypothetical protein